MRVYDSAHVLARDIKESEELKAFKTLHQAVMANPLTKERVMDFQSKQFEFQTAQISGQTLEPEKIEQIKSLYELLSQDELIRDYFQAEVRFGQMMSDVSKIISDAVELD